MRNASRWLEWNHPESQAAQGWRLERLTEPSSLYGANGLAWGPDGRVYVAQAMANRVSAIDPDTGALETIIPVGSPIAGPDDLAFDSRGNMYITDLLGGCVWTRRLSGELVLLADDVPSANGITEDVKQFETRFVTRSV